MPVGKVIQLHSDGVVHAALLYHPEVTEDLTLSVGWLRDRVTIQLDADEMLDLAHRLTKAVKKVRKHKRKLDKERSVSLKEVERRIRAGSSVSSLRPITKGGK